MECEARGKNQAALDKVIIRNPSGDFYFKYRFFISFWNPKLLGHGGKADTKLTIFPVSGLENYKHINNTRFGTMGCSDWRDMEIRGRMRWEMKISVGVFTRILVMDTFCHQNVSSCR